MRNPCQRFLMSHLKADKIIKRKSKWPKIFTKILFLFTETRNQSFTEKRLKLDVRFSLKVELPRKR